MRINRLVWRILSLLASLTLVLALFAGLPVNSAKAAGPVTVNQADIALSGGFQAGNFPEVWDLTAGDLTLHFTYDGNGLVDDAGTHAWAELGIRDQTTASNFNPNNKGVWLATDYDWTANTFDPDVVPNLDLDDKLILQKVSGHGEGDYNLPSSPPVPGNNHRVWWDRDGVDPYQNDETANTDGLYEIVITLHATGPTTGTAFMQINGLSQGFETDGMGSTIELTPAGMTFAGDMTRMQVFYGLSGYGATHSVGFKDISITGFPADTSGPVTSNVVASPNPAVINSLVTLSATIDDSTTGGWGIASAQYSVDGGDWAPMDPADGAFNAVSESAAVTFHAPATPGVYTLCVRGTDVPMNTGASECTMLVVYDPSGGFVTGGGWIWSPATRPATAYSSIPAVLPGSFPSIGYEATSTDEAGDHIALAGTDRALKSVTVSLTNWACENDFNFVGGAWVPNRDGYAGAACLTTPGSGYTHPITLNIYEVVYSGSTPSVGGLIATKTGDYFIPFRPSWNSAACTEVGQTPDTDKPFGGKWYDPVLGSCVHGFAFNINFDFSTDGINLPDEVIYGVAYNTAHYGSIPLTVSGPYDSLNLSLLSASPSIGTDVEPGTIFWDTGYGPFYCDGGAGGADIFRRDADCWDPYTPAVQFNVATEGAFKSDQSLEGKATFGFVAKYKKGAAVPDGTTEFQFKAGDLNFHSTRYDWLVVNQNYTNAQFKGHGTINGAGDYLFMLWAGDGSPDTFRIKIWNMDGDNEIVVYDNGVKQAIGGGSIVIHK